MSILTDRAAEHAVLAGLCQFGQDSYLDIADIIQETTFSIDENKYIFACLKRILENEVKHVDMGMIFSTAEELGLSNFVQQTSCVKQIQSLFVFSINQTNVRKLAAKLRKLEIARLLRNQLKECSDKILEVSGNEPISEILGIAENAVFDFSSLISNSEDAPKKISNDIVDYVEYLAQNPIDQVGIPSGLKQYDAMIGGGFRPGTVNVMGARLKQGKSIVGTNIGWHVANELKIPVLNLDTELTYEDHTNRLLAMASDCFINEIETGKFAKNPHTNSKVKQTANNIKRQTVPYHHKSIAGMPFEEQLAIMRRWIVKEVGVNTDGKANPCLIIYDYLKLMTADKISGSLQEYQVLGFMMTAMHNFAVRYKIPIFLLIQLNRDGIDNETSGAISGSDRVGWLCSNLAIFKSKSDEEIQMDGPDNGNRKLVVIAARHGPGCEPGNYINCYFRGAKAQLTEGKTKFELSDESTRNNS